MKKKFLLWVAPLIGLLLLVNLLGCDFGGIALVDRGEYSLFVSAKPPEEGDVIIASEQLGRVEKTWTVYPSGTEVELKPIPAFGYSFDHWSGDAWGSKDPLNISMHDDKVIYAHFIKAPYSLRVILSPPEGGIVEVKKGDGVVEPKPQPPVEEGDPSAWEVPQTYDWVLPKSETVTLTATPFEGYRFVAWASDEVTIENPHNPTISFPLKQPTTVIAYFALALPEKTPPEEALPGGAILTARIEPRVEIIEGPHSCISSILYVDYEAIDNSGGDRPVDYVQLNIDGEEWKIWHGAPTEHYKDATLKKVACQGVSTLQLKATNSEGQEFTVTKDFHLPPLAADFTYGFQDIPGEDCRRLLVVNYQAVDLTTANGPITNIVLKGNGELWKDSGKISAARYQHSFQKEVLCGQVYTIEVTATDAYGNKYTWREIVTIPTPEPQEEPPSPPHPEQTLYVAFAAEVRSISTLGKCTSTLTVSFDGKDMTGGDYPITSVKLKVTGPSGTRQYDSKPISNPNHHDSKSWSGLNCGETFNIEVTVTNSIGQEIKSTGSITTPIP